MKDRLTISIDSDARAKLEELASKDGRSLSSFINMIINRYLGEANE